MQRSTETPTRAAAIEVARAPATFADWDELLRLLHAAFARQDEHIDPPSSLRLLDARSIAAKARDEALFLAFQGARIAGCIFAKSVPEGLYVGKHAVLPQLQGRGVGRQLMAAVEAFARGARHAAIVLEVRIELTENHATYAALGFERIAEGTHEGYARPTFVVMRKALDAA